MLVDVCVSHVTYVHVMYVQYVHINSDIPLPEFCEHSRLLFVFHQQLELKCHTSLLTSSSLSQQHWESQLLFYLPIRQTENGIGNFSSIR